MKNGPYELVIAPPECPGKKYRGRYCYEHHLVWWQRTGHVIQPGEQLHHRDGNKRNNRFSNLRLKRESKHKSEHAKRQRRRHGKFAA